MSVRQNGGYKAHKFMKHSLPCASGMLVDLLVPPVQIHPPGQSPAGADNPVVSQNLPGGDKAHRE